MQSIIIEQAVSKSQLFQWPRMLQWEVDKILWAYCTPATTITYLWAFLNGQHLKLKCKWKGRKHSYKQLFLPNIVIQPLLQKSKQHHFNQGMHKNQVKFTQKPWMQKQATERHVERCNYSSGKKHRYTDRNNQSSTILNIKILNILQRSARSKTCWVMISCQHIIPWTPQLIR
jgi:hypothetical protein